MTIIRYLHYTIGITTPRPEQERTVAALWIISTLVILALAAALFFVLMSQLHTT